MCALILWLRLRFAGHVQGGISLKTFFNLALSGLSEADAKMVLETLESPKLGQWSLSEGGSSDLLIVDVDSVWGHMDWLRAAAEDRRCAAYTDQPSMRDCELLLNKPLDSEKLIQMLQQVQRGEDAGPGPAPERTTPAARQPAAAPAPRPAPARAACESASAASPEPETPARAAPAPKPAAPAAAARDAAPEPDTAPAASAAATPVAAEPPASVGALLLSGGISEPALVEDGAGGVHLFIDPANNIYRAPPQLKPIEKLLELPAAKLRSVGNDDPKVQHAGPEQPIVRLLWFAALCASKGSLAQHLDASAVWKLTRWPQIEREFPRHFRIATAMMKQAGTLADVAAAAKSPVEDVAGFINAYYLAGYVAAEGSEEPVDAANSTANVLSRLRRAVSR